jgi:hypothetical protein
MSIFQVLNPELKVEWSSTQKFILRTLVGFFFILSIPLDWKYFSDIAQQKWASFNYVIIFEITRYFPRIVSDVPVLLDIIIGLALAIGLSVIWAKLEKSEPNWERLYNLLRILVRYRLAAALLAYGFIKFFPIQSPFPSITLLNANYGDLSAWKIFSLSLGIVPDYQAFLGGFELLAALLLLHRKTASIGAFIALLFLGNVAMSNLAYEGGEFVYSGALTLFALFTFLHDWPKFYSLLFLRKRTQPEVYLKPTEGLVSDTLVYGAKYSFIFVFLIAYGALVYVGYSNDIDRYPASKGIEGLAGIYDVTEFVYNGDTIPYGEFTSSKRWKRVVFEEWATLSIESEEKVTPDLTNVEYLAVADEKLLYEAQGIQGWKFFEYNFSPADRSIALRNRNPHHASEKLDLTLSELTPGVLQLAGKDQSGNEIHATLVLNDKKYLLKEAAKAGRRGKLIL